MTRQEHPLAHGLLFKAAMVQALLAGIKWQTRRVVTWHNSYLDGARIGHKGRQRQIWDGLDWSRAWVDPSYLPDWSYWHVPNPAEGTVHRVRSIYQPGDLIWGKETWLPETECSIPTGGIIYRATNTPESDGCLPIKWRSAMLMPRWASRITRRIASTRAQRLQDISEADAVAEGVEWESAWRAYYVGTRQGRSKVGQAHATKTARAGFQILWDSINAPRGLGWAINPPVWAISFEPAKEEPNA